MDENSLPSGVRARLSEFSDLMAQLHPDKRASWLAGARPVGMEWRFVDRADGSLGLEMFSRGLEGLIEDVLRDRENFPEHFPGWVK